MHGFLSLQCRLLLSSSRMTRSTATNLELRMRLLLHRLPSGERQLVAAASSYCYVPTSWIQTLKSEVTKISNCAVHPCGLG